jgi:hypothetical protein
VTTIEHLPGCDEQHGPRQRCNVPIQEPIEPSPAAVPARSDATAFRLSRARFIGVVLVVIGLGALVPGVTLIVSSRSGDAIPSRSELLSILREESRDPHLTSDQVEALARADLSDYRFSDVFCGAPAYSEDDAFWTIECEATERECAGLEIGDDGLAECLQVERCGQASIYVRDRCRDVRVSHEFTYDDLEGELRERLSDAATRYAE